MFNDLTELIKEVLESAGCTDVDVKLKKTGEIKVDYTLPTNTPIDKIHIRKLAIEKTVDLIIEDYAIAKIIRAKKLADVMSDDEEKKKKEEDEFNDIIDEIIKGF